MTPLAATIVEAATKAFADQDEAPHSARVLREYQDDASAVAIAVLRALAGSCAQPGLAPIQSAISQRLLEMAAEIIEAGSER